MISINGGADGKLSFKSTVKKILTLFRTSEPFRKLVDDTIADSDGCGDRKAVIYAILASALPLYNFPEQPISPASYQEFCKLYKTHQAVLLIVNDVIGRRIPGDSAGQILHAIQKLNRDFINNQNICC